VLELLALDAVKRKRQQERHELRDYWLGQARDGYRVPPAPTPPLPQTACRGVPGLSA
jgi:hypothetical protein